MKRNDFIKSLQQIKRELIQAEQGTQKSSFTQTNPAQKEVCSCRDSNGEIKYLYHSPQELDYILSSTHLSLTSYPCPYEKGWHLTKG